MEIFKHEIERCFVYGWFFEEMLDEKQKREIPMLMKIAKEREKEKINKKKEQRKNKQEERKVKEDEER